MHPNYAVSFVPLDPIGGGGGIVYSIPNEAVKVEIISTGSSSGGGSINSGRKLHPDDRCGPGETGNLK